MLAFVLWMLSKIFRANISTYVNFSWRLCSCLHDDVGIWWLGCKQCIFPAYFGWRKIWYGIWKKVVLFCKCKLMSFFHFYSIMQINETLLVLTFLFFFRMWVSRVGCGRDIYQTSSITPFAVCWWALTIHVKCFLDELAIQMKLLMSIDHPCQMLLDKFAIQRSC